MPATAHDGDDTSINGFPRRRRLLTANDFRRVFSGSSRVVNRDFVVLGRKSTLPISRLGLAIAKKHLKRAVDRNRVKRIVRESFRLQQHVLVGLDFVVMTRRDIQISDTRVLHQSIDQLWLKLRKKCKNSSHT